MKKKSKNNKKPKVSKINKEKPKGVGLNNNLIPAVKGEPSRNPAGRPPNISSIPFIIKTVGDQKITVKINKKLLTMTKREAVVQKMYALAIGGRERAAIALWEREFGKPAQTIALGLIEGEDVNVIFQGADFLLEDDEGVYGDTIEDADFTDEDDGDNGQIKKENDK